MPAIIATTVEKSDLTLARPLARGDKNKQVRVVQEWLTLHDFKAGIDGDFGPATEVVLRNYQAAAHLPVSGTVDAATFDALTAPIRRATALNTQPGDTLNDLIVRFATQHLAEHPREVGGQNAGPWVRLYMDGNEGAEWPWCAGFATFIVRQAAVALMGAAPVLRTFSCDILASRAAQAGALVSSKQLLDGDPTKMLRPGSIFLVRRTANDWEHTGIVTAFHAETFETIEGNTNDAGDREGYEVCRRTRAYTGKDFIRI
jgi:hypothetical protein